MTTNADNAEPIVESVIIVHADAYAGVVDAANDIGGSAWAVVEVLLDLHRLVHGGHPAGAPQTTQPVSITEHISLTDLRERHHAPLHEVVHNGSRYWLRADHPASVYELHRELSR